MDISVGRDGASVAVAQNPSDTAFWSVSWLCEKWSEDAVNFARGKLRNKGITEIQDGNQVLMTGETTWDNFLQRDTEKFLIVPKMISVEKGVTSTILQKLGILPEETEERQGNLLLNEGIQEMWDLVIGATATSAYSNANARLGVGANTTAAAATQTALQDGSALYKAMVATWPIRTNQTMDFKSDFTSGEANFAWQEWSVDNGSVRSRNMNRKVESLGTKSTGTWTLTGSITIS